MFGCCNCLMVVNTLIRRPEDHGIWSMIESEVQLRPSQGRPVMKLGRLGNHGECLLVPHTGSHSYVVIEP